MQLSFCLRYSTPADEPADNPKRHSRNLSLKNCLTADRARGSVANFLGQKTVLPLSSHHLIWIPRPNSYFKGYLSLYPHPRNQIIAWKIVLLRRALSYVSDWSGPFEEGRNLFTCPNKGILDLFWTSFSKFWSEILGVPRTWSGRGFFLLLNFFEYFHYVQIFHQIPKFVME